MERTITETIALARERARIRERWRRWYLRIVIDELVRIPAYQDEADALRQGLRRSHANSRGRGQP